MFRLVIMKKIKKYLIDRIVFPVTMTMIEGVFLLLSALRITISPAIIIFMLFVGQRRSDRISFEWFEHREAERLKEKTKDLINESEQLLIEEEGENETF